MYQYSVFFKDLLISENTILLGPRQTGKTTLVKGIFPNALNFDLLDNELFLLLSKRPGVFKEQVQAEFEKKRLTEPQLDKFTIIVDEIQKQPLLLDAVQSLISQYGERIHFILTGSSARKLVRNGANMLGGRAQKIMMHPLSYCEVKSWPEKSRKWWELFHSGCLPAMVASSQPKRKLKNYVETYVQEEVAAEGIVRNVPSFRLFLTAASYGSGEQVVFENLASNTGVPARTVRLWFEILEDTLLGQLLPCFGGTKKRRPSSSSKFFLFDVGVANHLRGLQKISPMSPDWGRSLEHLVYMELRSYLRFCEEQVSLSYWRTSDQALEVDFVLSSASLEPLFAIEVKSSRAPVNSDFKGLIAFGEEFPHVRKILVCDSPTSYQTETGVSVVPVETFLLNLPDLLKAT